MNRAEFMKVLEQGLQELPEEEINNAVSYYTEYFDDAGPEHEADVIARLGSPGEIAAQVVAASPTTEFKTLRGSTEKGKIPSGCLLGLKRVFVTLPLFCLKAFLHMVAWAMLLCAAFTLVFLLLLGVCAVGAGIVSLVMGLIIWLGQHDGFTAMMVLGVGLVGIGAGTAAAIGAGWAGKLLFDTVRKRAPRKKRGDVTNENAA